MNKNDFNRFIGGGIVPGGADLEGVRELTGLFPWFHSSHLVLLRGLRESSDIKFESQLKGSALYVADRSMLYHYLFMNLPEVAEVVPVGVPEEITDTLPEEPLLVEEVPEEITATPLEEPLQVEEVPEVEQVVHSSGSDQELQPEPLVEIPELQPELIAEIPEPQPEPVAETPEPEPEMAAAGTEEIAVATPADLAPVEEIQESVAEENIESGIPVQETVTPEPEPFIMEAPYQEEPHPEATYQEQPYTEEPHQVEPHQEEPDKEEQPQLGQQQEEFQQDLAHREEPHNEEPRQEDLNNEDTSLKSRDQLLAEIEARLMEIGKEDLLELAEGDELAGDSAAGDGAPEPEVPHWEPTVSEVTTQDIPEEVVEEVVEDAIEDVIEGATENVSGTAAEVSETEAVGEESEVETPAVEPEKQLSPNDLIDRFIQTSPRIQRLIPGEVPPLKDLTEHRTEEHTPFITETLARIYINQGYYTRAINIYEKLTLQFPEKSAYFASRIEKIKELIK